MNYIRQATIDDLGRIAEILVFNYRLNFYPIFQEDSLILKQQIKWVCCFLLNFQNKAADKLKQLAINTKREVKIYYFPLAF